MDAELSGKVAIVTGGAQGIGRAIVEVLLREGGRVSFLDTDRELGEATRAELEAIFPERPPHFHHCDVTDSGQISAAVDGVVGADGAVDVLVNNAGVAAYFDAAEMTEEEWATVFAVDLKGLWLCCKHVLPTMRRAGSGSIVNIASIHARMTQRGAFPYPAAKAGVVGLTRSLAVDEGSHGIRVNAVSPGYTRTQIVEDFLLKQDDPAAAEAEILEVHPLGRIGTVAEIAEVVSFLASGRANFITGAEVAVDGGLSVRFA